MELRVCITFSMTMSPINGIIIVSSSTRSLFAAGFFNRGKLRHPKDSNRPYVRYNLSYQVEPPSSRTGTSHTRVRLTSFSRAAVSLSPLACVFLLYVRCSLTRYETWFSTVIFSISRRIARERKSSSSSLNYYSMEWGLFIYWQRYSRNRLYCDQ